MPKYHPSDHGKVVEGRIVLFLPPAGAPRAGGAGNSARAPPARPRTRKGGGAPSGGGAVAALDDTSTGGRAGGDGAGDASALALPADAAVPDAAKATPSVRASFGAAHFETDKAFPLAATAALFRGIAELVEQDPQRVLLVVGHTDAAGAPAHNLPLSAERAAAIAAALRGEAVAWMRFYEAGGESRKWGLREDQHMLHALGYYARGAGGPITGEFARAVSAFQGKRGLAVDGEMGPKSREALVSDYLAAQGAALPAGTQVKTLACGQRHLLIATKEACEQNRRVDVLAFECAPIEPAPAQCTKAAHPGCTAYQAWLGAVTAVIGGAAAPASGAPEGPDTITVGEEARYSAAAAGATWSVKVYRGDELVETVDDCALDARFDVAPGECSIRRVPGQWNGRALTIASGGRERAGIAVAMKPLVFVDSWTFRSKSADGPPHRPGEGSDFTSGDMTLEEYANLGTRFGMDCRPGGLASESDDMLFAVFRAMAQFRFTHGALNANTDAMIDKFRRNEAGAWRERTYSNEALTRAARAHESTHRFVTHLQEALGTSLATAGGDVGRVRPWESKINSPVYNTVADTVDGLRIAINDTWAYEVKVADCVLTASRDYRATLDIVIYDHFGLDADDLTKHPQVALQDGFRAWFLLQHVRGYRAFVTVIRFQETVEGSF